MPIWFASLLVKFPFLIKAGRFLTSGKFLAFIAAIVIGLFIITQGVSFIGDYVDKSVKTGVELNLSKAEVEGLKKQVDTLHKNQQVVIQVVKETKVEQAAQQIKADKIEDKIDEEVKNGTDSDSGVIVAGVIDSL
jgi:histone deacetylase complex regulatory component SIN3